MQNNTAAVPATITVQIKHERLKELLRYEPTTGLFKWIAPKGRAREIAGCISVKGYRIVRVEKVDYRAARLAWFYTHGEWPAALIDHINGTRSDDRIANLRQATSAQNNSNAKPRDGRVKGVSFHAKTGKWVANIASLGESRYLGLFETTHEAAAAYAKAAQQLHGEFARTA